VAATRSTRHVGEASVDELAAALQKAAGDQTEPVVVINADARAAHQSVVNVMEAARRVGLSRITFAPNPPLKRRDHAVHAKTVGTHQRVHRAASAARRNFLRCVLAAPSGLSARLADGRRLRSACR
jgi:hypothetical protein